MREIQEKNKENLKIICKAKEELENRNKEQNQQLKRLIGQKVQLTQTILNAQSTNNELEQEVTSTWSQRQLFIPKEIKIFKKYQ